MLIALTNWTMIILSLKSKKKKKKWKQEFMQNNIWMCVIKWAGLAVSGLFVLSWAGHLADLGLILVFSFYSRLGFKKKKNKKIKSEWDCDSVIYITRWKWRWCWQLLIYLIRLPAIHTNTALTQGELSLFMVEP